VIWHFLTDFGDTAVTVPLAVVTAAFLLAVREFRMALAWAGAILLCAGAIGALKTLLAVCSHPLGASGLASPSGHTAMSFAVYGGLAAIAGAGVGRNARAAVGAAGVAFAAGIAASRAILHYHTVLEVAVGSVVGLAALALIVGAVVRWRPRRLPLAGLAAAVLAMLLIFHGHRWPAERAVGLFAGWVDRLLPLCG